jgi:uncharacterized protein
VSVAPADCRRCGACCFSDSADYVWVRGDDWARLGERAGELAHFIGNHAFMRMREGHYAALDVRRDAAGGAEFFCTIYERRPEICRDLGRGSPECLLDRETKAATVASVVARG